MLQHAATQGRSFEVLAFAAERVKRLFFKEFCDAAVWREMLPICSIGTCYARYSSPAAAKEVQHGPPQATSRRARLLRLCKVPAEESFGARIFAEVLKHAEQKVREAKLAVFDRSKHLRHLRRLGCCFSRR
jgi:hypothetical protein